MATVDATRSEGPLAQLGGKVQTALVLLGDWTIFAAQTFRWLLRRRPPRGTVTINAYDIGVRSVGVVIITGMFIGMVLAVQAYGEFHTLGLQSRLGTIVNVSVLRELGPVLAATMLAGRVGSSMAAELATMRITEQIDALACLGINPTHYLAVPRLIACVVVIPLLTMIADFTGVLGGAVIAIQMYGVDSYQYWTRSNVEMWDIGVGIFKSVWFGAAIALISCHRGFNSKQGSEGVGRAATEAFVASFIAILALDFMLALCTSQVYNWLWPYAGSKLL
jgi:phospholipid/cholesterol/gamma-HCH transport system permease protein